MKDEKREPPYLSFSRWLVAAMSDARITSQTELAELSKVSKQYINGLLAPAQGRVGRTYRPTEDVAVKLARALKKPAADALKAAGYAAPEPAVAVTSSGVRLLFLFDALPTEKQEDLLIYAEAMFRKYGMPSELRNVRELGGEERRMPVTKANQSAPPQSGGGKKAAKKKRAA